MKNIILSIIIATTSSTGCSSDSGDMPDKSSNTIGNSQDIGNDAGDLSDVLEDVQNDVIEVDATDMGPGFLWISGDPSIGNSCDRVCEDNGFVCEEGPVFLGVYGLRAEYTDNSELLKSCEDSPPGTISTLDGMGTADLVAYTCRCVM